jgi:hypothetical protein
MSRLTPEQAQAKYPINLRIAEILSDLACYVQYDIFDQANNAVNELRMWKGLHPVRGALPKWNTASHPDKGIRQWAQSLCELYGIPWSPPSIEYQNGFFKTSNGLLPPMSELAKKFPRKLPRQM